MKQCPECNEVFDNQKAFCDMDGSELMKLTDSPRAISETPPPAGSTPVWVTGVIGGLIGIIICVLLYIAFLAPSRQTASQNQNTETVPTKSNQIAVLPPNQVRPSETASPTETQSPAEAEASPAASPAAPAAATPAPAVVNHGPIAIGDKNAAAGERTIIKMKDGSSVEADAAWEDKQGVWFRRSNVVSFLDKSKVEAIIEAAPKRPSAAETKTP